MIIGVPKEIKLQEHRIGLTPESVKALTDKKHEVLVQDNGGFEAGFTNDDYLAAGAKIIQTPEEIFKKAEFCSMCGPKHCPMNSKISDETLDELNNKLTKCKTAV